MGKSGIGTSTPFELLDVNGGIRVGFSANNNAGTIRWTGTGMEYNDGASWTPFSTGGGGGLWNSNGSDIYSINSGNVGIGTSSPLFKLHLESNFPTVALTDISSGIRSRFITMSSGLWIVTDDSPASDDIILAPEQLFLWYSNKVAIPELDLYTLSPLVS